LEALIWKKLSRKEGVMKVMALANFEMVARRSLRSIGALVK